MRLACVVDVVLLDARLHMRLSRDGLEAIADNALLEQQHLRLG